MKAVALTSGTFHTWLKSTNKRYSVLMVKSDECIPCGRVTPIYEKYVKYWSSHHDVQFGTYTINWSDREFIQSKLQIKATPTFHVYDGETKVFSLTSASRINELKAFLLENIPFAPTPDI